VGALMQDKINYWTIYIVLLILFLIRFLPFIFPEGRLWGFNHLIFNSDRFVIIFVLLSALAIALPLSGFSIRLGESLANYFTRIFFESKRRLFNRLLFINLISALFVIFAAPTHFLGDGYAAVSNLACDIVKIHKWSELGSVYMVSAIQSILGESNLQTARTAYQVLSIISGMITLWFFFLIAGYWQTNKYKSMLIFTCLAISGTILLFFGYAESYPILWAAIGGYVYYSIRFIENQTKLLWAVIFLIFGILLHLQTLIFIPSCLYLIYRGNKAGILNGRYRILILSLVAVVIVAPVLLFIYKYSTDLYFRDIFLPLFNGKDATPDYPLLGLNHLLDILNLLSLLSPALPIIIILGLKRVRSNEIKGESIFWGIILTFSLAFLFVIDPMLGMPRDWDLFSFSALGLTMFFIYLIPETKNDIVKRFLPSIVILLSVSVLPYLMTNLNEQKSIRYSKYLINLDRERSRSAILTLRDYYENQGNKILIDSVNSRLEFLFPDDRRIFLAFEALERKDFNQYSYENITRVCFLTLL
jgi:hypothetical protein